MNSNHLKRMSIITSFGFAFDEPIRSIANWERTVTSAFAPELEGMSRCVLLSFPKIEGGSKT